MCITLTLMGRSDTFDLLQWLYLLHVTLKAYVFLMKSKFKRGNPLKWLLCCHLVVEENIYVKFCLKYLHFKFCLLKFKHVFAVLDTCTNTWIFIFSESFLLSIRARCDAVIQNDLLSDGWSNLRVTKRRHLCSTRYFLRDNNS